MMRCTARSVIPTSSATSRIRASDCFTRHKSTCAWFVRNVQLEPDGVGPFLSLPPLFVSGTDPPFRFGHPAHRRFLAGTRQENEAHSAHSSGFGKPVETAGPSSPVGRTATSTVAEPCDIETYDCGAGMGRPDEKMPSVSGNPRQDLPNPSRVLPHFAIAPVACSISPISIRGRFGLSGSSRRTHNVGSFEASGAKPRRARGWLAIDRPLAGRAVVRGNR